MQYRWSWCPSSPRRTAPVPRRRTCKFDIFKQDWSWIKYKKGYVKFRQAVCKNSIKAVWIKRFLCACFAESTLSEEKRSATLRASSGLRTCIGSTTLKAAASRHQDRQLSALVNNWLLFLRPYGFALYLYFHKTGLKINKKIYASSLKRLLDVYVSDQMCVRYVLCRARTVKK